MFHKKRIEKLEEELKDLNKELFGSKKDLKEFGQTTCRLFEIFKKEKVKQTVRNISEDNNNEFVLNCQNVYLGTRDLQKEQEFNKELKELMKKYKVIKCKVELIKNF